MITEEEKAEIIDKTVEKALLMLPEVVGNMMAQHVLLTKLNSKFYADNSEFKDHKQIVASVVEMVDGSNPGVPYEELLKMAIPEIKHRISTSSKLDLASVTSSPSRDFNGAI